MALSNDISPAYAAEKFLWFRKPATSELPQIRSISDIAWAAWNRAGASNIKDIKYLVVTQVMNPSTRDVIRGAYGTLSPPQSETKVWPGIEFSMDSVGGQAILGTPVGRWAGHFFLQHKAQLGGNRSISKVRVFKNADGSLPYLVFYVDPDAVPDSLVAMAIFGFSKLVKREIKGKNLVREHLIRVGGVGGLYRE